MADQILQKKIVNFKIQQQKLSKIKKTEGKDLKETSVKIDYQEAERQLQAIQCMYIWNSKGQKRGKEKENI